MSEERTIKFPLYTHKSLEEEIHRLLKPLNSDYIARKDKMHKVNNLLRNCQPFPKNIREENRFILYRNKSFEEKKIIKSRRQYIECKFCKRNGDPKDFYQTHVLKDAKTGKVICPILRNYTCEYCGATGDYSHTRSYCPFAKEKNIGNAAAMKQTLHDSSGKIRKKQ
ncbi:protein nanos-like [Centruroides sculpturatus]|uniref:protein nanos-like n=1 Tax=Centruroides sculpturatus TaxID=218467 RepID=UPI000C6DD335|nr:protein nanos-like [Centruroides sculpturatus]